MLLVHDQFGTKILLDPTKAMALAYSVYATRTLPYRVTPLWDTVEEAANGLEKLRQELISRPLTEHKPAYAPTENTSKGMSRTNKQVNNQTPAIVNNNKQVNNQTPAIVNNNQEYNENEESSDNNQAFNDDTEEESNDDNQESNDNTESNHDSNDNDYVATANHVYG